MLASSSKANCAYVSDAATPLLLDAGLSLRVIRGGLDFGVSRIAAALITHSHKDHCAGARDLAGAGIDCYMLPSVAEATGLSDHHRARIIKPMERFTVGTWSVLPFDTPHDVDNIGFLMASGSGERLLYLTDTPYCRYKMARMTHVLLEINYHLPIIKANVADGVVGRQLFRRTMHSHMSLDTALEFLRVNDLSRVEAIWLMHLSDRNSDEAMFKQSVQRLTGKPVYIARR